MLIEFIQPDGEQPSTSRSLDDDEDGPDDLSDPLSSTETERPGNFFYIQISLNRTHYPAVLEKKVLLFSI